MFYCPHCGKPLYWPHDELGKGKILAIICEHCCKVINKNQVEELKR